MSSIELAKKYVELVAKNYGTPYRINDTNGLAQVGERCFHISKDLAFVQRQLTINGFDRNQAELEEVMLEDDAYRAAKEVEEAEAAVFKRINEERLQKERAEQAAKKKVK